jgi:hypothetical protein
VSSSKSRKRKPPYRALAISGAVSVVILVWGAGQIPELDPNRITGGLLWPLLRLMMFITIGLMVGQVIETSGWTRHLAKVAAPLFRFGNLGDRCSAAFTTAFFSGVAANAMLLEFYKSGKITKQQLFLTNFVNQMPAYFLHLPTTFFIVVPLTRWAGIIYFILTFVAMLVRTILFLIYGHFKLAAASGDNVVQDDEPMSTRKSKATSRWQTIKDRLPGRITRIAVWVLPVYVGVFVINAMGIFSMAREWMARYVVTSFVPMESLSVVILSFAAEFTSGFAAAGALLDAGVLTTKQTALALLAGNIVAFPIRALRHQLPRYIGIFSPKMGTQLLLMGQAFRVGSLIIIGCIYYWFF